MKTKTLIFMVSLSTICFTGYACDLEDQDKTENVVVDNNSETTDDSNNSQNITVDNFTEEELDKAATAKGTTLSQEEQKVIQLCNLARLDGNKFMEYYAKPYLKNKTSNYISSLYSTLATTKNLPMLYPEASLCQTAAAHAEDMGSKGLIGHNSSDGTNWNDRINELYDSYTIAENCSYGYARAIEIVMQLLVDEGTASLGHRKNILSNKYNAIGVAIRSHRQYGNNCVQDFGDKIITKL
ncbi:MAG: CAP domain-containing protein [Bacteroidales bacterium]|jgi:hypothetical protein|nr:CAP domain-containing protein [Bacteroidales bacterium]